MDELESIDFSMLIRFNLTLLDTGQIELSEFVERMRELAKR